MRQEKYVAISCVLMAASVAFGQAAAPIVPVDAKSVQMGDGFWKTRMEVNRTVTVPLLLERAESTGKLANFDRAAAAIKGGAAGALPANAWDDAEAYKAIEAASWTLLTHPDAALEAKLEAMIARIAAAQEADGYLYTGRTINPAAPIAAAGAQRWVNEKTDSYELYNLACLIDAALAHNRATGKKTLLDVAVKAAELLDKNFGPAPKQAMWPGHPGIESSLTRLSMATKENRYATLAAFMIDTRGPDSATTPTTAPARGGRGPTRGPGSAYSVAATKFTDQTQAAGHGPSAMQLYVGAAELALHANKSAYTAPLEKIHDNLVNTKMYITGGIGAGNDGVLPRNFALSSVNAYSSTDAAARFIDLNETLFQLKGDARYIDIMERTLYNALLAGISLDGKTFFETSALEFVPATGGRGGRGTRREAFTTAYTPVTAAAMIARVPEIAYAQSGETIYVNLFAQSTANIKLPNGRTIKIEQQTNYPQDGMIKLTITPDQPTPFTLKIRLPLHGTVKGGLYTETFAVVVPDSRLLPSASLNNGPLPVTGVDHQGLSLKAQNGYGTLNRQWSAGETLSLELPMSPMKIAANDQFVDGRDRIVFVRGPIVYCVEGHDNPAGVRSQVIGNKAPEIERFTGPLAGISGIRASAHGVEVDANDQRVPAADHPLIAIPFYAWANRGPSEMAIWLPANDATAVATSKPTLIATARLSASPRSDGPTNPAACRDGLEPRASSDNSPLSHFDWWPSTNGKLEWVAAEWDAPQNLSSTSVYWWDDTGVGECRPPTSWKAFYKDAGGNWVPVETTDAFGVEKDKYNRVNFKPVQTTGIKLECIMPPSPGTQRLSVGIQEWKIR